MTDCVNSDHVPSDDSNHVPSDDSDHVPCFPRGLGVGGFFNILP